MTGSEIRQAMISAREEYIGIIKDELLGPGSEFSLPDREHELISSTPTSRYYVGILFPQGNAVNQETPVRFLSKIRVPTPFNKRNREPMHLTKLPMKTWTKKSEWLRSTCLLPWVLHSSQAEIQISSGEV